MPGASTGWRPAVSHSIAATLTLVDRIRQVVYDRSLAADDALRRLRDLFAEHDRPEGSTTP